MAEKPIRVGELVKTKAITRAQVEVAAASIFDGKTALALSDGYALLMPDLAKMTPYSREAIMTALIEAGAVKA